MNDGKVRNAFHFPDSLSLSLSSQRQENKTIRRNTIEQFCGDWQGKWRMEAKARRKGNWFSREKINGVGSQNKVEGRGSTRGGARKGRERELKRRSQVKVRRRSGFEAISHHFSKQHPTWGSRMKVTGTAVVIFRGNEPPRGFIYVIRLDTWTPTRWRGGQFRTPV